MIDVLTKLATHLDSLGFSQESQQINVLIKSALPSVNEQRTKLYSSPDFQKFVFKLLQDLGLNYTFEAATYFMNASQYLKEGVNERNLFLAGLSISCLIPGLESLKSGFDPSPKPEVEKLLSELILKEQGKIQAKINRLKEPKIQASIQKMIPDGQLLITHADRIWAAMRQWAFLQKNKKEPVETDPLNNLPQDSPLNQF